MAGKSSVLVVGGTSGIGRRLAEICAERGDDVTITGRDNARAQSIAKEIGKGVKSLALDISQPKKIAEQLASVGPVRYLALAAIDRDENTAKNYHIDGAIRLVTLKLVGYTEVIHTLLPRLAPDAGVVLFGGLAKERPYVGSTTVTTINGGVSSMIRTLAVELAPIRFNALHPGIVGDSPAWNGKPPAMLDAIKARTPTKRLATMTDTAMAALFLMENQSVNGINLTVDGGWLLM